MRVEFASWRGLWYWEVYIGKDLFGVSARGYKNKKDAKRAFQKLDRLF